MTTFPPTQLELRRAEAATWGRRANTTEQHVLRQAKLKKWTPRRSGALLGFCSVQLPSGMILNDLGIITGKNGPWVAMPAQKQVDRDGQPRLDANGKPIYSQIVEFRYRATADRFAAMVLNLVRREHPADLAEAAP